MSVNVALAGSFGDLDEDLAGAHQVMVQLRPAYGPQEFAERVRRMMEQESYRLALLRVDGEPEVVAAAGFSVGENLAWGRYLYVHDLVTDDTRRSAGHGRALFDWLVGYGRKEGCAQLHLDSGVKRFDAHRFYLCRGMKIASHHFSMEL
jgi:GNAT superfamily N-acetyltransferase